MFRSLLAAELSLLLCTVAGANSDPVWAKAATPAFAPPESPVILTRTVLRPLAGGQQVAVTRRYEIQFTRAHNGFQLDGRLLDVQVEAPPQLAKLAELEHLRRDAGLFPVFLDSQGMILQPGNATGHSSTASLAVKGAEALLAGTSLPNAVRRELASPLVTVSDAGNSSAWPPFLFNPGPGERSMSRDIALSDGSSGSVEITIRAERLAQDRLPQRVERTITTRLSQTERVSREIWTISY